MQEKYYIVSAPLGNLSATEVTNIAARALRTADRKAKVTQYPLVDGGEGTIEHLVTATLGSFLEVEATGATGEQIIVPLGFAGESGNIGVIEMGAIAREKTIPETKKKSSKTKEIKFTGTTYGVGELIRDSIDEGANSVLLGWEEPLARDAGFGMAQAMGIKFFDEKKNELDFRSETPLHQVHGIDMTSRPFEILSSRYYVARSASVLTTKRRNQVSVDETIFEAELDRIARIMKKEYGIDPSQFITGGSYIDFGLAAFLAAEIRDGASLVLEGSGIAAALANGGLIIILAERLEDITSDKASQVMKDILRIAGETNVTMVVITQETPKAAAETRAKNVHPFILGCYSLDAVELFAAPIAADASAAEKRRQLSARLEKLLPRIIHERTEADIRKIVTAE